MQDLPKVTVDDGYEFLGWKVSGKSDTTWKASKESFTFEDANANFYPATATEGYTTVTAEVQKVEKKKQLISHLMLIRKKVNLQIQRTLSM